MVNKKFMPKQNQTTNAYDQVFDFIFGVQKKKSNKPFPKPRPSEDGEYLSALIEIGTQPAIYPLEASLDSINRFIAKETELDFGGGVKAGLNSGAFSNIGSYASKEISKERAKSDFARVGGNLHHGIDGALVSLFAKGSGIESRTAANMGMIFSDVQKLKEIKKTRQGAIFGIDDEEQLKEAENRVQRNATSLLAESLVKQDPGLSKGMILETIRSGQKIENREERFRQTVERLKYGGLPDVKERAKVAEKIWGKGNDLGIYRNEKDGIGEILGGIGFEGTRDKTQFDKKIRAIANREAESEKDRREQKDDLYRVLKSEYGLDAKTASLTVSKLTQEIPRMNTGVDVAEKALYSSIVSQFMGEAIENQDYETVARAKSAVKGILEKQSGTTSFGTKVARARIVYNWAKEAGGLGDKLISGDWERFGNSDLNFTQIVKSEDVFDENGKKVGQFITPARSTIGALMGDLYYLHPSNFIKGTFLNGGLLLKMSSKWDSQTKRYMVNKKSMPYLLYQARLGNVLSAITKPIKILNQKVLGLINPLANGLKKIVKNFLVKLLGATGVGGIVVNLLMRIFGDQVAMAISQVMMVLMLGILGILLILLDATGFLYSEDLTKLYSENNKNSSAIELQYTVEDSNIFTNEDYPIEP